jgi:hypothetical protein
MSDANTPVLISDLSGVSLLRLARSDRDAGRAKLRSLSPDALASACAELRPEVRSEFLMLLDHPEDVVPLLPIAEVAITIRSGGMSEAAWLLEIASPEQRVACIDLDCWDVYDLERPRVVEWIDALIEAGRPTLLKALDEWDPEVWLLALRALGEMQIVGKEDEPPPGWFTVDGVVYWNPLEHDDFARLNEIAGASFSEANPRYWQLVYGMLFESQSDMEEYAIKWRSGRMNDLGFPDREQALRLYTRLEVENAEVIDATVFSEEDASSLVQQAQLPAPLRKSLVGEALCELPMVRAMELLGYVLGVANAIAVTDQLRLSETESIPRAIEKALAGIEIGLRAVATARDLQPHEVLDRTVPGDLFRIGATLDDTLREGLRMAGDDDDSEDEDGEGPDDAAAE